LGSTGLVIQLKLTLRIVLAVEGYTLRVPDKNSPEESEGLSGEQPMDMQPTRPSSLTYLIQTTRLRIKMNTTTLELASTLTTLNRSQSMLAFLSLSLGMSNLNADLKPVAMACSPRVDRAVTTLLFDSLHFTHASKSKQPQHDFTVPLV
jgi:hypothetical protein